MINQQVSGKRPSRSNVNWLCR